MLSSPASAKPKFRVGRGIVVTVVLAVVLAILAGVAIGGLPLFLSAPASVLAILVVVMAIVAVAPNWEAPPPRILGVLFIFSVALYFVWPRYVFLPIPGLPVKHPQRAAYLLLVLMTLVFIWKSPPFRRSMLLQWSTSPWLNRLWFGLFFWLLLSAFAAPAHKLGSVVAWTLDFLVVALLYPIFLACAPGNTGTRRLLGWLIGAGVVTALVAVPETLLRQNLFARFGALDSIDANMAAQVMAEKLRGGRYRAQSSFDHPLLFAEFLAVVLPFAIGASIWGHKRRAWASLSVLLIGVGLVLSASRVAFASALIGLAILAITLVLRGFQRGQTSLWPLILALLITPFIVIGVGITYNTVGDLAQGRTADEAVSSGARVTMLYQSINLIQASPLTGYGPGQGASTLNFRTPAGIVTLDNYILVLGLEGGVPALLIYFALGLALLWLATKEALRRRSGEDLWWVLALPSAIGAFYSVKFVLGTASNNVLLALLLGMVVSLYARAERQSPPSS